MKVLSEFSGLSLKVPQKNVHVSGKPVRVFRFAWASPGFSLGLLLGIKVAGPIPSTQS